MKDRLEQALASVPKAYELMQVAASERNHRQFIAKRKEAIGAIDKILDTLTDAISERMTNSAIGAFDVEADIILSRFLEVGPLEYGYNWSALQEVIAEEIERNK